MALVYKDRVRETATTTGTGTFTLAGAVTGFQSFSAVGNANTCYYVIEAVDGNNVPTGEWECGLGTYTSSGTTLARTTVLASSNSGSAVNFSAGTKHVYVSAIADQMGKLTSEVIVVPVSDESTAITTGTAKVTFRMPFAMTLTAVRASLSTASTSGNPAIDVNEGGVSIFSTTLTVDANEKTSTTATTAAVLSDTALADDAEITIDIDTAGTGAKGLKVSLIGYRT